MYVQMLKKLNTKQTVTQQQQKKKRKTNPQTRELNTALKMSHKHTKKTRVIYGHSPGMQVNARYINYTRGTSFHYRGCTSVFRPKLPAGTLTWHASKYKVRKHNQRHILWCSLCSSGGVYVLCSYSHAR